MIFGKSEGYPTERRPFHSRHDRDEKTDLRVVEEWYQQAGIKVGSTIIGETLDSIKRLLYTWWDLFASDIEEMPTTDLVYHYIHTWPGSVPVRAREKLYTTEEVKWMETKILAMLKAGIIEYAVSLWSHRTKFVQMKDGGLRMVHVFCPINAATINHSYPMKRIEPVINSLTQAKFKVYLQADAANGF
ncbi:DNA/RNA polymerase [Choiromyces venosus 120613-1]|uniref:DNA/RNA polymerase n=1 Tax=Choiromyces venosus 120613-1 TaxID=1336337 RepID=A0A3N4J175_9PEZI|nr:DNA/RNA polymerase [Choiromyces venosus 120613-1]